MTRYAPLWQQAGSYPAQLDRSLLAALWPAGGVLGGAASAVANTMTVSIAPGSAAVPLQPGQGTALCRWDAAEVVTLDAAPGTGQFRWDMVVAQVRDTAIDAGPNTDWLFTVVKGTVFTSGNDVYPTAPPNALGIALVGTGAAAANLNAATVRDLRGVPLATPGRSVVVHRFLSATNIFTNPLGGAFYPDPTDAAALQVMFVKQSPNTKLILRITGTLVFISGTPQHIYLGMFVAGATPLNYMIAQHAYGGNANANRDLYVGQMALTGVPAGIMAIAPIVGSAGAAGVAAYGADDYVSFEVEERY